MRTKAILLLGMTLAACHFAACTGPTSPGGDPRDIPPLQNASERPVKMAIIDYQARNLSDPEMAARYAQPNLLILDAQKMWGENCVPGTVSMLKDINPDLKVLGYVRSKVVHLSWVDDGSDVDRNRYPYDLFDATRPYWCWTTAGDTLMDWPDAVVIDFTQQGCRDAMVQSLVQAQARGDNLLDGIFWDYFGKQLFICPEAWDRMEGQPDMDGDGIGHFEDDDEREAFRAGQVALIQEIRAAFGEQFIQVFNGGRAHTDSTFAALGDGMLYEDFPCISFNGGPNMQLALDPERYNNLFAARNWPRTQNGGPWLIVVNKYRHWFYDDQGELYSLDLGDINRVVALMTDATVAYTEERRYRYGWPEVDIQLGQPITGVEFAGQTLTRQFEHGRVTLTFTSGNYPFPFDYEIEQAGRTIQSLQIPHHFP
jgi:hypothetical protein